MWSDQLMKFSGTTPIHEGEIWRGSAPSGQLRDGPSHRSVRCRTRVISLDLSRRSGADAYSNSHPADFCRQDRALRRRQHLGISNTTNWLPIGHQDRTGYDWSG
jgi:hypothetical protein